MQWSVGVITAPRRSSNYLHDTLQSLDDAGWSPIVFAEPGAEVPEFWPIVRRRKPFGDWSNWACALYELLLTDVDADYYFMAEDDIVVSRGVKRHLETWLPKLEPFGLVSFYCPGRYHKANFIGFHNECEGWKTFSTQTVIMSRNSVIRFFADYDVQRHRFEHTLPIPAERVPWGVDVDPKNSIKDCVLGMWAERCGLPVFFHSPSLCQHTGTNSTLSTRTIHTAPDFAGEDFEPSWDEVMIKRYNGLPVL